jgi:hypothetical protein
MAGLLREELGGGMEGWNRFVGEDDSQGRRPKNLPSVQSKVTRELDLGVPVTLRLE